MPERRKARNRADYALDFTGTSNVFIGSYDLESPYPTKAEQSYPRVALHALITNFLTKQTPQTILQIHTLNYHPPLILLLPKNTFQNSAFSSLHYISSHRATATQVSNAAFAYPLLGVSARSRTAASDLSRARREKRVAPTQCAARFNGYAPCGL